jgi:hypothetical protein
VARTSAFLGHHARRAVVGALLIVTLAIVTGLAFVAVQAKRVHDPYGAWALSPGAHTPVNPFGGRNYDRGDRQQGLPADIEHIGTAPSDGEVFSTPPIPGVPPTVLYVRYPDGTVFDYALSGGP